VAMALIVLIIVLILLYLIGFRRMAIWLIIGASVNSSIFWLLGTLLFIDYLVSGGDNYD
jgi:uncharacterized BrkB/YihY/UPF0761 family membrane protein